MDERTYVAENNGRDDCIVVAHTNVALEWLIHSSQLFDPLMELRLAQRWHVDVV
jgi:hypothetical protein